MPVTMPAFSFVRFCAMAGLANKSPSATTPRNSLASSSRWQRLHPPPPVRPGDGGEVRLADVANFEGIVLRPRHAAVALEIQDVEPLRRKRQRHEDVGPRALGRKARRDLLRRGKAEKHLPGEIGGDRAEDDPPLGRGEDGGEEPHAERTSCSTLFERLLKSSLATSGSQRRGRGRDTSTSASTRPFESTTTRFARNTASGTSWVMKSTVGRRSCQMRVSSSWRVMRV